MIIRLSSHSLPFVSLHLFPSLRHMSHSHSPTFFPSLSLSFLVILSFPPPLPLKTFSISTHNFSIKLAYQCSIGILFYFFKQQEQQHHAAWLLYSPHTPLLTAALLIFHLCTGCLHPLRLLVCPPLVIAAHSPTFEKRLTCAQRCIILIFSDVDGRLGGSSLLSAANTSRASHLVPCCALCIYCLGPFRGC